MPESIETAPRDGTVILTDAGFVRYLDLAYRAWASAVGRGSWACCDPAGHIFDCADHGYYLCEPELWEPMPAWLSETP